MDTFSEKTEHLYLQIAGNIEQKIKTKVIGIGDKLPSLRRLCEMYNISQSTAMQAYYHLESKSLIEARPQSGYFVSRVIKRFPAIPATSQPVSGLENLEMNSLLDSVFSHIEQKDMVMFSHGVPAEEMLPVARLNKGLIQAMRDLQGSGTAYEITQGNVKLRRQIAKNAFRHGHLTEEDIVTTTGCINALSCSLMAITKPGDTIIVESPVYFGILQLAQSLGLRILELPTHPETGIQPDALKKALETEKVKACILISNFSNPLGSCMPDEHKKEVVRLIQQHHVALIEDDLYGDVYFGRSRPSTCKSFDESGLVLWCGSVSKTLAPGYRVGWVAPGIFKEQVNRIKLLHTISSTSITQEVIANFLETGRYENHMRKMRHTLYTNYLQYLRVIQEHFPEGTKVSRPQGGFVLWVEFDRKIDTIHLFKKAAAEKISFSPGRMFTLRRQFDHCLRLNYGLVWTEEVQRALIRLGEMAKEIGEF
ncbi:aminotransferase class I/II-fold pyridoxal phosphate-dependent enzyme [Emticicia sp. CRIBPO]|uniref:aminotransferase-like domain-containing protein n=1 Tax=Emticicia sp. CRIBPO TaxID=2683258 RepID=UPI00141351EB|nr:PLP-dependent aminotransferase family protein [Emticicia sp. CRIBPO]NBA84602.1 aminotransferase class I/II-fold pyridoxal phosphate-dependent enzyme [Emticicia sp. CRIBPO]